MHNLTARSIVENGYGKFKDVLVVAASYFSGFYSKKEELNNLIKNRDVLIIEYQQEIEDLEAQPSTKSIDNNKKKKRKSLQKIDLF